MKLRQTSLKVIILLLVVVGIYQACGSSNIGFISLEGSPSSNSQTYASENNGSSYGGKMYLSYIPEFKCEETETFTSSLTYNSSTVDHVVNKRLQCGAIRESLDATLIDSSIYQKEVIGYQSGIFEGFDERPDKIPANLVEVWCRDRKDSAGIEIITHYDRVAQKAVQRLYYTDRANQQKIIPDFSVTRLVSSNSILVRDGRGFELTVLRDQPAPEPGLFLGKLAATVENKLEVRDVSCRLGGSVSPSVWPAQKLIDEMLSWSKLSPDRKTYAYMTQSLRLGVYHQPTQSNKLISQNLWYVTDFSISPDSKYVIFNERWPVRLGRYSIESGTFQFVSTGTQAGQIVIGSQNQSTSLVDNRILKVVDWSSPQPTIRTVGMIFNHLPFVMSRDEDRSAFIGWPFNNQNGDPRLYLVNNKTGALTPVEPESGWTFVETQGYLDRDIGYFLNYEPDSLRFVSDPRYEAGKYFVAIAEKVGTTQRQHYVVSFDGQFIRAVQGPVTSISEDYIFSYAPAKTPPFDVTINVYSFPDSNLKLSFPSTIFPSRFAPFITLDKKAIVTARPPQTLKTGPYQATYTKIADGQSWPLCSHLAGELTLVRELTTNQFLLVSAEDSIKIRRLYIADSLGSCREINTVSGGQGTTQYRGLSGDKRHVLLQFSDEFSGKFSSFDVPLDGRAPVRIDSYSGSTGQSTWGTYFGNSDQILFFKYPVDAETGGFLWRSPSL